MNTNKKEENRPHFIAGLRLWAELFSLMIVFLLLGLALFSTTDDTLNFVRFGNFNVSLTIHNSHLIYQYAGWLPIAASFTCLVLMFIPSQAERLADRIAESTYFWRIFTAIMIIALSLTSLIGVVDASNRLQTVTTRSIAVIVSMIMLIISMLAADVRAPYLRNLFNKILELANKTIRLNRRLYDATFRSFPHQMVSTVRWGILSAFMASASFGLSFAVAMIGVQLTLNNITVTTLDIFLWVMASVSGLIGLFCAGYGIWLAFYYMLVKGSNDPTTTKTDLNNLEKSIKNKIDGV